MPDNTSPHDARPELGFDDATLNGGASNGVAASDKTVAVRRTPPPDANSANADGTAADGMAADGTASPPISDARVLADEGEATQLAPGERLGPYEVQAHVGDGGMAAVYRVWHTNLHRVEALKVPRQQGRYGPEAAFLRRLLAEARTVAKLHHPHIAAIHSISEADAPLQYFSMEFVDGGDLASFLAEQGRLSPKDALPILEQVAGALDYAHSQNVIHRDIKPANILLQRAEEKITAKVVDFGISRAGEDIGGTRLTRSGMIVGTPEYMSPEQSGSGDDVTNRTDIYSLGILAYEMLCGAPPFVAGDGVSRLSILMKHVGEAPESLVKRAPGLPSSANDAILKALAKKPEERYATCGDFVVALGEALAGHDGIIARHTTFMPINARDARTRAFSSADGTLEMETAPAIRRARTTTLLAGLGGLLAGAALVFGWLGYGAQKSVETTGNGAIRPVAGSNTAKKPDSKTAREYSPSGTRVVVRREAIPFARRTQPDKSLLRGQKRVVQGGRNGQREVRLMMKDGRMARRGASRIVLAPRPEITRIGTKEPFVEPAQAIPPVLPPRQNLAAKRSAKPLIAKRSTPRRTVAKRAVAKRADSSPRRTVRRSTAKRVVRRASTRRVAPRITRRSSVRRRQAVAITRRRSTAPRRIVRRAAPRWGRGEAALPP